MKFPLHAVGMFAAGFLSLGTCLTAQMNQPGRSLPAPKALPLLQGALGSDPGPLAPAQTITIPGPLRSFLRMAGISQEIPTADVLPMLARNVFLHGYESGRETEYLLLVERYLRQARELQRMTGPDGALHVANCEEARTLIHVLGYKFERGCSSSDASLVTQEAERAFLTVDSGFPLTELEEDLQRRRPFVYPFPATAVPILFTEKDWNGVSSLSGKGAGTLLDVLLRDLNVDRLYSAMARMDPETRQDLLRSPGLKKLFPLASVLDFYGGEICIRDGSVAVPGGADAVDAWQKLVGSNPRFPGGFVPRLLERDHGWLAAYFDAMSRVSPDQQAHFVGEDRLRNVYEAYRSASFGVSAASGVFPRNAELLLLLTRLRWQPDGEPRIPGDLKTWQEILEREARANRDHQWARRSHEASSPERLLEVLASSSNIVTDTGLEQIYLTLSAIDDGRGSGKPLSPDTARLLADKYADFYRWYLVFTDFPSLDDGSITQFIKTAEKIDEITNPGLRANALGAFQADIGLWQIFTRQGQIATDHVNASWQSTIAPFNDSSTSVALFNASRNSLEAVLLAASGKSNLSEDQIIELLAGPAQNTPDGRRVHDELARRIDTVLNDQRLVSLDTLFQLYDGLDSMAHGAHLGASLMPLAESLREFEMPRPIFTGGERVAWSPLIYTSRHAELQVRTDLTKILRSPGSAAQLEGARGRLTPFLRDTLVGLNYAYYEPPGSQVLHDNPLFVRSHDFSVSTVQGVEHPWDAPELVGIGVTAGGGAYLMGSLAGLPYALAETEEDFIAPHNIQALIWKETVPELLVDGMAPRWWQVTAKEMHAAALYQKAGEELIEASANNPQLRAHIMEILSDRMPWGRLEEIGQTLQHEQSATALATGLLPSDTFYLAAEFRKKFPGQTASLGPANRELDDLSRADPQDTDPQRLARDFGVPHPTLADSDNCTLLESEPFPVSGGYTSRLFGESWESSNLYWARLADQKGYSPVMLNLLVPQLTRDMVANIFATNIDDWPALLRAMNETGQEFQQGKITVQPNMLAGNATIADGSTHAEE
jgi:hypothetical protein